MVGDGGGTGWPGNGADGSVCLEWGPKAETKIGIPLSDWWYGNDDNGIPRANKDEFRKYDLESDDDLAANPVTNRPFRNWELFVGSVNPQDKGFELAQYGPTGFQMVDILTKLRDKGYTAVCYGPVTQGPETADVFNVAALIATQVSTEVNLPNTPNDTFYIQDDDRYTPLRLLYENAASSFILGNTVFMPHAQPCDSKKTCPGCPE